MSNVPKLDDCLFRKPRHRETPTINIYKDPEDPGAMYVQIYLSNGTLAALRIVYDHEKAKNVVDYRKSEIITMPITDGHNRLTLIMGNGYLGTEKDIARSDEKDTLIIDQILDILDKNKDIVTWRDEDGFIILDRSEGFNFKYATKCMFAKHKKAIPHNSKPQSRVDLSVCCYNIDHDDDEVIAIVNMINMCGNRVEVKYMKSVDVPKAWIPIAIDVATTIIPQKPFQDIIKTAESLHFAQQSINSYMNAIINCTYVRSTYVKAKNDHRSLYEDDDYFYF